MCSRKIKKTMKDLGVIGVEVCKRPDYRDGLCAHHYKRQSEKSKVWGERRGYLPATELDLYESKTLKLKDSKKHRIYRFKKVIQVYEVKTRSWVDVDIAPDFNLFCVKSVNTKPVNIEQINYEFA
jgi:hypothetical protein